MTTILISASVSSTSFPGLHPRSLCYQMKRKRYTLGAEVNTGIEIRHRHKYIAHLKSFSMTLSTGSISATGAAAFSVALLSIISFSRYS
jgi:hypothetical protein